MIIREISKFISNLNYEDIPESAIDKAKFCLIDYLAVTRRGMKEKSTKIAIESVKELYGEYSPLKLGFIYGIASHCLDLDDGHTIAQLHPGCLVFSTALAICNEKNLKISGKEFLTAVVGGYETAIVLGQLANPYHRNQGFHSTGTIGTFAAGVTAAKLLKLDIDKTISALGLCGTQSSGLLESNHQGSMGKYLHVASAITNGITASFLAYHDFKGSESIFDGDEGFLKALVYEKFKKLDIISYNDYLTNSIQKLLGKFHINEVYFKKYPFCRHLHSSIDATLNIINKFNFNTKDINNIIIKTYNIAANHDNFNPITNEDFKQSLPYAIAITCLKGNEISNLNNINNLFITNFDSESSENNNIQDRKIQNKNIKNKNIQNFLDIIKIEESKKFNNLTPNCRPSKVTIETNSNTYEDYVELPCGEDKKSFSKDDLLIKFQSLNPDFKIDILKNVDNLEFMNFQNFMEILINDIL